MLDEVAVDRLGRRRGHGRRLIEQLPRALGNGLPGRAVAQGLKIGHHVVHHAMTQGAHGRPIGGVEVHPLIVVIPEPRVKHRETQLGEAGSSS